jgi:hypothetical protein
VAIVQTLSFEQEEKLEIYAISRVFSQIYELGVNMKYLQAFECKSKDLNAS